MEIDTSDRLISGLRKTIHVAVRVLAVLMMFAIGGIVLATSIAYWLIHKLPDKEHEP